MTERNSVTWNAMIKGYISERERAKKCCKEALVLFRDMLSNVSGQNPIDICVLSACSQLKELYRGVKESEKCFDLDCHGNWFGCSWEKKRSIGGD
ncbi:hypothetical protein V6N12_023836 [Hibiscus sabdariffa]|uniref:Pentatricopeptide repeat-containing protein n=1 Tax=Hibiscus sabdariffa TaxID=183260 RepID=A0ABR2FZI1_9ROSI